MWNPRLFLGRRHLMPGGGIHVFYMKGTAQGGLRWWLTLVISQISRAGLGVVAVGVQVGEMHIHVDCM